ncbi:ribonuclease PH [Ureibacillus massiliensis 4400831 = CIP 108448 = CCUG 49529]|uniref:Ribonuclease PH n=1 Tax=Ureibacillus massiliensis 4400831 = CIP 108448 = CCUG 49529 TaxID=1211035 RepID=A0A0A3JWJ4_9BACL|nr:ribonuclease PH [Ureibacillus massiliensis]KGR91362.1 ribonuclease PH [Ureibacillus massiliensis 4400831 = CIP 108448 = CCUG 49529]
MSRHDGRNFNELREVKIEPNYLMHPEGSVLIQVGNTKVICTATIEDKVPGFLRGQGKGWITAEYSMLPRATAERTQRDASRGKINGRTMEIQRLIGRALRSIVDLEAIGEKTVWIDCDVIQADGGTRTASITGAFVALTQAISKIHAEKPYNKFPIIDYLAATSVGFIDVVGAVLDLDYIEDSKANVDMNLVMTGSGRFVEIQGTGEEATFSRNDLNELLDLGEKGISELIELQKEVLGDVANLVAMLSK